MTLYLLHVEHLLEAWPEQDQRTRCVVPLTEALARIADPAVRDLIRKGVEQCACMETA